jgi:hypothetical protein
MRAYNLLKLVERYGSELTLVKSTAGAYDPATGSATSTTENFIFTGYFYNSEEGILVNDIRRGSSNVVIPYLGLGTEPDDGDQITGIGDTVSINRVRKMYNGGTPVCYICEVSE